MEQKIFSKPSVISRLPKFGGRLANGTSSCPLQAQPTHQDRSSPGSRSCGATPPSPRSMKWKTEDRVWAGRGVSSVSGERREPSLLRSPGTREVKKPSTSAKKVPKSASSGLMPSPKTSSRSCRSVSSLKSKPQTSSSLPTMSSLNSSLASSSLKPSPAGTSLSTSSSARGLCLAQPCSLASSSSSLPVSSLNGNRMVRSQSFTQFTQLASPLTSPITRSASFTRALELAKPLANTRLCLLQPTRLTPPQSFASRRLRLGHGEGRLGSQRDHTECSYDALPSSGCSTPPSGLKKHSVAPDMLSKPTPLDCQLAHSSAAQPCCPQVTLQNLIKNQTLLPHLTAELFIPDTQKCESCVTHADLPELQVNVSVMEEADDTSCLKRNGAGKELSENLEHLREKSPSMMMDSGQDQATPTQTQLYTLLCETERVWAGFADMETNISSSPELSPSNSSGGTYMWDEDMLEPVTHSSTLTHCCSNHQSHLSTPLSIDVADLQHLESCELKKQLLQPEDRCVNKGVCADACVLAGCVEAGEWSVCQQQRWTDVNHNRSLAAIECVDHMVVLDELSLMHMMQDCSSLKSQLLQLQLLLQMEDSDSIQEQQESHINGAALQVEELMREVQSLREELEMKDRMIAELQHQQREQDSCPCLLSGLLSSSEVKLDSHTCDHKSTQTPRRPHQLQNQQQNELLQHQHQNQQQNQHPQHQHQNQQQNQHPQHQHQNHMQHKQQQHTVGVLSRCSCPPQVSPPAAVFQNRHSSSSTVFQSGSQRAQIPVKFSPHRGPQ